MSIYELCGQEIETPLLNAAGSINGINEDLILGQVGMLSRTCIGGVSWGSLTVPGQVGNERVYGPPVYHYDPITQTTFNSIGLANVGLEVALKLLPEVLARTEDGGKPLIVSVSPTKASKEIGDTFEQLNRLVSEMLRAGVRFIEVNTSCPNRILEDGGREPILGYDLDNMLKLDDKLSQWAGDSDDVAIGIKLPVYETPEQKAMVPKLATAYTARSGRRFLTATNTIPGRVARDKNGEPILSVPGGMGGMSGPSTKHVGREQLQLWKKSVGDKMTIISALGIDSGKELAVRRQLGATAGGIVTSLYQSRDWGKTITDFAAEWSDAEVQEPQSA